jgi:hypothetical protein
MHGIPDAGSTDGSPAPRPPDWPAPGTPLPGEEPTIELPVVTEAMLAAAATAATPTLVPAGPGPDAPGLAGAGSEPAELGRARAARIRRIPTLTGRGHRPATLPAASDNVLFHPTAPLHPTDPIGAAGAVGATGQANRTTDEPGSAGPAEPGRRWMVGAGIAAAALLLTGATVIALTRGGRPADPGWSPPAAAAVAVPPHTVTGALAGRTVAGFDLVDGAQRVTVRAASLGDRLYRISTPEGGGGAPRTDERNGRVRLRLDGDAQAVEVVLNAAVRWDLRFAGGAASSIIDLSGGRVGGVALTGGATRIDLTLPRPDGTLIVRMSGGVSLFDLRTAERTPVRVRVGRGAGQVTLDGRSHAGVAAGHTFTPAGWAAAVDKVDVDAAAGMSALTVAPY